MIRTVTLNTGFDETYLVSDVRYGGVSEVLQYRSYASGKGINAARTLSKLGKGVRAYALVGNSDREQFAKKLVEDGVEASLATVAGSNRRNLTLVSQASSAPAAHFRAPGFSVSGTNGISDLLHRLEDECKTGDIISLHGSAPEGSPKDVWSMFAAIAKRKKAIIAVDVYGDPLLNLLKNNSPFLCKPNDDEIRVLPTVASVDVETATRKALIFMLDRGVQFPAVTRGSKGIWFVEGGHLWVATLEVDSESVLVGAGDACMAGMLAAISQPHAMPREMIAIGAAVAAAHVEGTSTTEFAQRSEALLERIRFSDLGPLK